MNVVKYYRTASSTLLASRPGKFELRRVRVSQAVNKYGDASPRCVSRVDADMLAADWTRRRPRTLKPHSSPAQMPGYRQPSEQMRRRARQLLRKKRAA